MTDWNPPLSPASIAALVDVITGGKGGGDAFPIGIYRSATELRRFFAYCDIEFDVGAMSSRTDAVHRKVIELSRDDDGRAKICRIIEALASPTTYAHVPARRPAVVAALNQVLTQLGDELSFSDGHPKVVRRGTTVPVAEALQAVADRFDLDTVQRDLARALGQVESDPEGALTAACSLVESVCRTILARLGKTLPKGLHLRPLADATREALGLGTTRAGLPPQVAENVNQTLTGISTTLQGIAALRSTAGSAHGRTAGHPRIDPRIARLGVNAAGTMALFLVETWQQRQAAQAATVAS